jgi:diguanylate cyclase (GGDEF)-like protein
MLGETAMPYEVVHTFGTTVYFLFILLFYWTSRIPRTNSGAGWWALSMTCALLARLSLFFFLADNSPPLAVPVYIFLNVLEKPLLLIGVTRFLDLDIRQRWFWLAAAAAELWLAVALLAGLPPLLRALGYVPVNAGFMFCMAYLTFRHRTMVPGRLLGVAAAASFALALHWLSAPIAVQFYPEWYRNGFILGTALVLVQYITLLGAVLMLFQKRLIDAESRALDMAFLDSLTGLNNQRYMHTLFDQALVLATRPHHVVAVLYIDLDNFKPVNDSAGHAVGDEVLKLVAGRLRNNTRSTDICARVGGDEFVVIATQLDDEDQAYEIARKLLLQLMQPMEIEGKSYTLGASIGIGLYPRHGSHLADLLQCADTAMYSVKRNGKSGCAMYHASAAELDMKRVL